MIYLSTVSQLPFRLIDINLSTGSVVAIIVQPRCLTADAQAVADFEAGRCIRWGIGYNSSLDFNLCHPNWNSEEFVKIWISLVTKTPCMAFISGIVVMTNRTDLTESILIVNWTKVWSPMWRLRRIPRLQVLSTSSIHQSDSELICCHCSRLSSIIKIYFHGYHLNEVKFAPKFASNLNTYSRWSSELSEILFEIKARQNCLINSVYFEAIKCIQVQ